MPERVPSDHEAVTGHRITLETVGRTGRPRLPLPDAVAPDREVVRLSLSGEDAHARVGTDLQGRPCIESARADAALARAGDGADLLGPWLEDRGIDPGETLVVDVVTAGYQYGVRPPGERVVYRAREPPSAGLRDIADRLG